MDIKFYIIIVTFNAERWLSKCLKSTKPYDIIIIDNNSTDNTIEIIKAEYPYIHLIEAKKNLGFGKANNLGIDYALRNQADYVFLLNQDAYLEKDCLENLISVHNKFPDFGILSPIHLNGKGIKLDEQFSYYLSYRKNQSFYSDYVLNNSKKEIYEVPFVNAAGWLISKECLNIVGGFDPIFFHYGEDDNYCQRLKYHNLKIGVVPGCFLRHDREFRIKSNLKKGTKAYLQRKEILYKREYANINKANLSGLEKISRGNRIAILKSLLKLDFKELKYRLSEHDLLKRIVSEVKKSMILTKRKQRTYLSIDESR